ncbi:hypothetical protein [Williamwhitmania taraxaci]|uniref:Outer membrane protein beta-barrel family protein n=1 Tax=Williamwhitmania taraxaci TaxID=1640674 RepID=A0A1G6TWN8_9BACT|nr:hypothetical protein [Williamwhitmania taraxaci]SDD33518.1 hypothetical protein SAMN05216323_11402 [Williamwhitmania taraxaci]
MNFCDFKRQYYLLIVGIFLLLCGEVSFAQDIEGVIKAPILTSNGGLSLSQISTFIPGDTTGRADPYTYYLAGNVNFSLFSVVNVPVSFAYTNNQLNKDASMPFNRFSIAPSYKWIKVYAGYSSMTFSPYTLVGHELFGGGVELTFESGLKVSAIYGRMKKEVKRDSVNTEAIYKRMGGGFKIEHSSKFADIGFNIYKAKDVPNASFYSVGDSAVVAPMDNIAGSLFLDIKIIESVKFNVEYAISAINSDISRTDSLSHSVKDRFVEQNGDLAIHHAVKAGVSQSSSIGVIGATYERVSPNYNTFGAYYFVNDYENITANFSTSIKKRVNLAADVGYQRDNLSDQKLNSSNRLIYSTNISSMITKKLNVGVSYSNLKSYMHIKEVYSELTATNPYQNLDTLSFTQLNLTTSCNANYTLVSSKESRQSINGVFTYQEASEQQKNESKFAGNRIYNSVLSYQYSRIPQKFNASTSVNYNHNQLPAGYMGVFSYNISLQKAFFEKLKVSFIGTYSRSFNDTMNLAKIVNLRIGAGYTFVKRHNFNLSLAEVFNQGVKKTSTQYSVNLTYSYMFDFNVQRKEKKTKFQGNF